MKKKIILIVIIILICGILAISFLNLKDIIGKDKTFKNVSDLSNNIIENAVKKIDESKELVYLSYEENYNDNIFKIPYINIDSEDAKKINEEIDIQIKSYIAKVKDEYKEDDREWFNKSYDYISNINGNVLTLVITFDDEYNYGIECVYNINIYTGNQLSNESLLKLKNINYKEIDLKLVYDKVFIEAFDCIIPSYLKDDFEENKEIKGVSEIANTINSNYYACIQYYEGKTLEDTKFYLGNNNAIFAEIIHMSPVGTIVEARHIVNITEILNTKGNNWYMIEDSDKTVIGENTNLEGLNESLSHLSNKELNIAYNEIFARHGHDFKSELLKEHFSSMLWYNHISGKIVSLEELNDVEKENVRIMKDEIDKRKVIYPLFDDSDYFEQST